MKVWTMKAEMMNGTHRWLAILGLTLWGALGVADGTAQNVDFDQLVIAQQTSVLLEHDGLVIGGVVGGGLVFWDAADPSQYERLTSGRDLSGNNVTDLAWTGRSVWVATLGGGLTRISDVAGQRSFRQYASNRTYLDVNAVTGVIVGGSERVYYGMNGAGVGLITNEVPGAIYTADQDGLISGIVNALQVHDSDLFVATPVGISRFANNLFTDQNAGLTSLVVNDLTLASNGDLLAATDLGVFVWDAGPETWSLLGSSTAPAFELSCVNDLVYVLGNNVRVYNGSSWQVLSLPVGRTTAIYAGDDFWIGGRSDLNDASRFVEHNAFVGRLSGATTFTVHEVHATQVRNARGVTFSGGVPYIGADNWQSVVSLRRDDQWEHIGYAPDEAGNEGEHLSVGLIQSATTAPDDIVWAGLYAGTGLARINPATGVTDLINPTNSGMRGKSIVNVVVHPDGPVITLHDWVDHNNLGLTVEILVDPDDWANSGTWLTLPLDGGLGDGPSVWDAVVQRRDVIWFAVETVGLVRWDINGDLAGPDDLLTWLDQSDDRWDPPVENVSGSNLDLRLAQGLEVGPDESLWAGGNGLLHFSYDESDSSTTMLTSIPEKTNSLLEGLVNGNVTDVARDANDHMWVATATGINRVRGTGLDVEVDAYLDLANYVGNPLYGKLYSPNVISPLPGTTYRRIMVDRDGTQLIVSADQGATLITVSDEPPVTGPDELVFDAPYLYPNPMTTENLASGLSFGGLPDGTTARVSVYNLEGQLIYTDEAASQDNALWFGQNRVGNDVATGLYLVRIATDDEIWTLTLAVVR